MYRSASYLCSTHALQTDVHASLDSSKYPADTVPDRVRFFEHVLRTALHAIPISTDNLRFVTGSSHQVSKDYTLDNFKLMALVSEDAAKDAGPEVKSASGPSLAALLYPGLQALDEQYLGIDFAFGGPDQVKNLFHFILIFQHPNLIYTNPPFVNNKEKSLPLRRRDTPQALLS